MRLETREDASFVLRPSDFVIHLVHVALIAFVALQLFDVFVRHILAFAPRFLDDFA
jgi:hypothetical protein